MFKLSYIYLGLEGWRAPRNQRKFFDTFARSKNFNPSEAENWHSVTRGEILRAGGSSLLNYHNGSHIKALVTIYPEIKENLLQLKEGWKALGKQRAFFDEFARAKHLNPLDAEKWYSVSHTEILKAGGESLIAYYNRSHIKALMVLYPELMLKEESFLLFKVK